MNVLTLEQAAQYLQLSPEDLQTELEQGHIPGHKFRGQWRVHRAALDHLLGVHFNGDNVAVPTLMFSDNQDLAQNSIQEQVIADRSFVTDSTTPLETPVPQPADATDSSDAAADQKGSQGQVSTDEQHEAETTSHSETDKNGKSTEEVAPSVPPPGRVWGQVFLYNPTQGYGHARLPDNRVVWLDSQHLLTPTSTPFPGDTVEFELHVMRNGGLRARQIKVVSRAEPTGVAAIKSVPILSRDRPQATPSVTIMQSNRPVSIRHPKKSISPGGTRKSQELYQKAAIARTEGRFDDARRFFRQAIEAGGSIQMYATFIKMEIEGGRRQEARQIIQQAMQQFPDQPLFYEMYGQMERRARKYHDADKIFRDGLRLFPDDINLKKGLARTLVQIGTERSFQEAGQIFQWLERKGKLDKSDSLYHRYHTLQRSPRANKAYDFFRDAGMKVGITRKKIAEEYITDIVFETNLAELHESFGLSGCFLVRCLQRHPRQIDIVNLQKYMRKLAAQEGILGLEDREVVINPSLAFIAVPESKAIRDQIFSILSKDDEVIIPLDDEVLQNSDNPLHGLRDLLGRYLGQRDIYSSTHAVSGRRFFGREHLLRQLTDLIHQGQFLGIFGLRKMGKTSLVYQLRDEKLRGAAVAYVDLQASAALSTRNCAPLYWELERSLYCRLKEQQQDGTHLLRLGHVERFSDLPDNGASAALFFNEDIRAFLGALRTNPPGKINRLVIVLDELERILPIAGQQGTHGYLEFFGLLRGLAQQYPGLFACVVVAANAAISERGYWEGRENPVFALYKPIFLPPLLAKECAEMIVTLGKGMSVYWEPDALQAVFDETGGHPFLTRSFCSRLAQTYPDRPLKVTAAMVQDQILPFIRDDGDKLAQIMELLKTHFPQEEVILEQIALGEVPADLPDAALSHLLGYSLIQVNNGAYHITLNLLRRWLRRRAGEKE